MTARPLSSPQSLRRTEGHREHAGPVPSPLTIADVAGVVAGFTVGSDNAGFDANPGPDARIAVPFTTAQLRAVNRTCAAAVAFEGLERYVAHSVLDWCGPTVPMPVRDYSASWSAECKEARSPRAELESNGATLAYTVASWRFEHGLADEAAVVAALSGAAGPPVGAGYDGHVRVGVLPAGGVLSEFVSAARRRRLAFRSRARTPARFTAACLWALGVRSVALLDVDDEFVTDPALLLRERCRRPSAPTALATVLPLSLSLRFIQVRPWRRGGGFAVRTDAGVALPAQAFGAAVAASLDAWNATDTLRCEAHSCAMLDVHISQPSGHISPTRTEAAFRALTDIALTAASGGASLRSLCLTTSCGDRYGRCLDVVVAGVALRCPALEHLVIPGMWTSSATEFQSLLRLNPRNLRSLDMREVEFDVQANLAAFAKAAEASGAAATLTSLSIAGSSLGADWNGSVTEETVCEADRATRELGDALRTFRGLRHLEISETPASLSVHVLLAAMADTCAGLRSLVVAGWPSTRTAWLDDTAVQRTNLGMPRALTALEHLDLRSVPGASVHELVDTLPASGPLVSLVVYGTLAPGGEPLRVPASLRRATIAAKLYHEVHVDVAQLQLRVAGTGGDALPSLHMLVVRAFQVSLAAFEHISKSCVELRTLELFVSLYPPECTAAQMVAALLGPASTARRLPRLRRIRLTYFGDMEAGSRPGEPMTQELMTLLRERDPGLELSDDIHD